jgi:hypothetical protein
MSRILDQVSSLVLPGLLDAWRLTKRFRARDHHDIQWHYVQDWCRWSSQINNVHSEQLAGVEHKIALMNQLGSVKIIGGLTTGGNDEMFQVEWPEAVERLFKVMHECAQNEFLFLYVPSPFWSQLFGPSYKWLPTWDELYAIFNQEKAWSVFQYSTSFDAAGRYFFAAQKRPSPPALAPASLLSRQTFRVFFHPGGADLGQGNSSRALSAHLCNALMRTGASVYSYAFDNVDAVAKAQPDDVLIGHFGPWVKIAHEQGKRRIVLYNPVNRWYSTRDLAIIEANATLSEQLTMSRMVIAQSGVIWRLTTEYPEPQKWRWINLGVDPTVFPRLRHRFHSAGERRFCFVHLYDAAQKGADIAQAIVEARPNYRFTWIGGVQVRSRNVRFVPTVPNTTRIFRRAMADCDFILVPSREDAQPGTLIEAASLGLLPVAAYTSGYSLSYPRLVTPNTTEAWLGIVDTLQNASQAELQEARHVIDSYLRQVHDWYEIEAQITWYLRELLAEEHTTEESTGQRHT